LISVWTRLSCTKKSRLTFEAERIVRSNRTKLVEFTAKVEKNSGARAVAMVRVGGELAQKLIARLQRVQ